MKVFQAIKYILWHSWHLVDKIRNSKHDIDESEMKHRVPVTGSDSLCNPFHFLNIFFFNFFFPDRTQDERGVQAIVICSITISATLLISAVAISLGKPSTKNWQEPILLILAFLTFVNFKSTCNCNIYLFSSCKNIFLGAFFEKNLAGFQTFLVDGLLQPCKEGNNKQLEKRQS